MRPAPARLKNEAGRAALPGGGNWAPPKELTIGVGGSLRGTRLASRRLGRMAKADVVPLER
jgi:hypothetical protein